MNPRGAAGSTDDPDDGRPHGAPYGDAGYGAPHGDAGYGGASQREGSHGEAPYGEAPYGEAPYGEAPYGEAPYGDGSHRDGPHGGAAYGGRGRGTGYGEAQDGVDGPAGYQPDGGAANGAEDPEGGLGSDGEPLEEDEAGGSGRGRRRKKKAGKPRSFWKELPILIGVALVLALLIKTFLVQAFSIPSDSMQDTLQRGDRVLVDKLTPWFGATPDRGEVVVFRDPGGWLPPPVDEGGIWSGVQKGMSFIGLMPSAEDQNLIKRVIAVGGDTVECEVGGQVMVNGTAVDESDFIYPGTPGNPGDPANTPCDDRAFEPVQIPEGRLWVMGDHRHDSQDSRFNMNGPGGGTVSEDEVVGRAIVIAWPPGRMGTLPVPSGYSELNSALAAAPAVVGLAGALPLVLWRRRLLLRRSES